MNQEGMFYFNNFEFSSKFASILKVHKKTCTDHNNFIQLTGIISSRIYT